MWSITVKDVAFIRWTAFYHEKKNGMLLTVISLPCWDIPDIIPHDFHCIEPKMPIKFDAS